MTKSIEAVQSLLPWGELRRPVCVIQQKAICQWSSDPKWIYSTPLACTHSKWGQMEKKWGFMIFYRSVATVIRKYDTHLTIHLHIQHAAGAQTCTTVTHTGGWVHTCTCSDSKPKASIFRLSLSLFFPVLCPVCWDGMNEWVTLRGHSKAALAQCQCGPLAS